MVRSQGSYFRKYERGRTYHTFVPAPLQNINNLDIDNQLMSLLVKAHSLLGKLNGMFSSISEMNILKFSLAQYEAVCSVEIEKRERLHNERYGAEPYTISYEKIVALYANLLLQSEMLFSDKMSSLDIIKRCHSLILNDNCGESERFRTTQLFTYPKAATIGGHPYCNPPNPNEVMIALTDLEKYLTSNDTCEFDAIIKIGLVYYQLSTICPFLLGNGLVDRAFINLLLVCNKILPYPLLCLSDYLLDGDILFQDILGLVRESFKGYETWLKFFLKMLIASADKAIKLLDNISQLRQSDLEKLRSYEKCSSLLLALYDHLWKSPVVEARSLVSLLGVSYNTAAKAVKDLCYLGILEQLDFKERYRRFGYEKLNNIIS